jgi:hypothetical protein
MEITIEQIRVFETCYDIKLPEEVKAFYLTWNGYESLVDMIVLYALDNVKRVHECEWNLPEIGNIQDYFIIGDFGFQASFWLLQVTGDDYKLYTLNLGVVRLVEIAVSFQEFVSIVLDDPYLL